MNIEDPRTIRYALRIVNKNKGASPETMGLAISALEKLKDMDLIRRHPSGQSRWYLTEKGKDQLGAR